MKVGDAVRLTIDEGALAAGALGVVLDVCRNGGVAVLLVEFEAGTRVVPAAMLEQVTRVGASRWPSDASREEGEARARGVAAHFPDTIVDLRDTDGG